MASRTLPPANLARGIRTGNRAILARAITLIESKRADHRKIAHLLVQELLPHTGSAVRLGITGAPGAGKSTTIDVLGTYLTRKGHKVAVLAVDPSSTRTGGSILGDKTRMAQLAMDANAFCDLLRLREHLEALRPRHVKPCWFAKPPATTSSWSRLSALVSRKLPSQT